MMIVMVVVILTTTRTLTMTITTDRTPNTNYRTSSLDTIISFISIKNSIRTSSLGNSITISIILTISIITITIDINTM